MWTRSAAASFFMDSSALAIGYGGFLGSILTNLESGRCSAAKDWLTAPEL